MSDTLYPGCSCCGPPTVNDCNGNPIPETLFLTIHTVGGCSCYAGTYPLTSDGIGSNWFYGPGFTPGDTAQCGSTPQNQKLSIELGCEGRIFGSGYAWGLQILTFTGFGFNYNNDTVVYTESPLFLVFPSSVIQCNTTHNFYPDCTCTGDNVPNFIPVGYTVST